MKATDFLTQRQLSLNEQQVRAVSRTTGQTLLLAVPGSGKTTVIVARLGYLILGCGVRPSNILTMSYNVAAVQDLRARFEVQFGAEIAEPPVFRTINGFCAKVLMAYARGTGKTLFRLMAAEAESARLMRDVFQELTGGRPTEIELRSLQQTVSYARNRMLKDGQLRQLKLDMVDVPVFMDRYAKKKRALRLMDYDDQLEYAYTALRSHPELLRRYQRQFLYIQVDEAQDISYFQHQIIRLLTGENGNLLLVGDEDQSIYGFRAAYPDALFMFRDRYPSGEVLPMETNYRGTGALVEAADQLIHRNRNRHDKQMRANRPMGEPPQRIPLPNRAMQYAWLADFASSCRTQTAILYRNNDSALPLIDLLLARGIPFYCREHDALYLTHFMVRDLCNALRFARRPNAVELFHDLYYKFNIPIGRTAMEQAVALHQNQPEKSLPVLLSEHALCADSVCARLRTLDRQLARAAHLNTEDALRLIKNDTGFGRYLEERNTDETRLDTLFALAAQNPEPERFLLRLDELRTQISAGCGAKDAPVILSTIHSAKGLEFDRVILMDVWDGILPASCTKSELQPDEQLRQMEEERRLFYVGVTRAKNHLAVLEYQNNHGCKAAPPQFLRELFGLEPPETAKIPVPDRTPADIRCPFLPGARVHHKLFGDGTVTDCKRGTIAVAFDSPSRKRVLDLSVCMEGRLLRAIGNETT